MNLLNLQPQLNVTKNKNVARVISNINKHVADVADKSKGVGKSNYQNSFPGRHLCHGQSALWSKLKNKGNWGRNDNLQQLEK